MFARLEPTKPITGAMATGLITALHDNLLLSLHKERFVFVHTKSLCLAFLEERAADRVDIIGRERSHACSTVRCVAQDLEHLTVEHRLATRPPNRAPHRTELCGPATRVVPRDAVHVLADVAPVDTPSALC